MIGEIRRSNQKKKSWNTTLKSILRQVLLALHYFLRLLRYARSVVNAMT
jgi:hypothetical protein